MADMFGLWAGTRKESGRLSEVQSRRNCVRIGADGCFWSSSHVGCTRATEFIRSGISLLLTSWVALQTTKTCADDSTGAWQSLQAGLMFGWSRLSLSLVRKSPDRNLRCSLSLFTSWVVMMLWRQGCVAPCRPVSCTFRYCILEFDNDNLLSSFSFDHGEPLCVRESGDGREYF